jgi:hypothetical protein
MSAIRTALDNARDPLEALRAFDARLPLAMQNADLVLLDAVRCDIARRWQDDGAAGIEDHA